jgi:hypothetical protein
MYTPCIHHTNKNTLCVRLAAVTALLQQVVRDITGTEAEADQNLQEVGIASLGLVELVSKVEHFTCIAFYTCVLPYLLALLNVFLF